jgi:membrane protein
VLKFLLRLFVLKVIWDRWRSDPTMPVYQQATPPRPAAAAATATRTTERSDQSGESGIAPQRKGEPGPDTPLELTGGDWKVTLKRTLKELKADRIPFMSAAMAYYFFLAIFPALIAVVGIMGLVNADTSGVIGSVESSLPGESGQAVSEAFREADKTSDATSLTSAVLGIAVALWSASSGMVALQTGLNVAYDVPEDRKFIGKRAVALLLLLATVLLGGVPSPIFTFGESTIFVVLGWVLTIIAVMVLFSLFYYIGPKREKPTWQWVSAGGVVGATLWIVASVAFGFFVENYSNYSKTYGSLAGVIVLVLLLYLTSMSVLIGGELNAELERTSQERARAEQRGIA